MRRRRAADCDDASPFPLSLQRPSPFSRLSSAVGSRIPHPLPVPSLGEVRSAGVPRRRRERGERGLLDAPSVAIRRPPRRAFRPQAVSRRAANGRPEQRSRSGSPRDDPGQGSGGIPGPFQEGAAGAPCPPGATAVRRKQRHPPQAAGKPRARSVTRSRNGTPTPSRASRPPLRPPPHLRAVRRGGVETRPSPLVREGERDGAACPTPAPLARRAWPKTTIRPNTRG